MSREFDCQFYALYCKLRTAHAVSLSHGYMKEDPYSGIRTVFTYPENTTATALLNLIWALPECKKIEKMCHTIWSVRKEQDDMHEEDFHQFNALSYDTAHRFLLDEMDDIINSIVCKELNDSRKDPDEILEHLLTIEIGEDIRLKTSKIIRSYVRKCHLRQILYYLYLVLAMLETIEANPRLNNKFWGLVEQVQCFEIFSAVDWILDVCRSNAFLCENLLRIVATYYGAAPRNVIRRRILDLP